MRFTVRQFTSDDERALRTFHCADPNLPVTTTYQAQIRAIDPLLTYQALRTEALVADREGTVIGLVVFGPTSSRDVWTIRMLAVARPHQRQGVGMELKRKALAACAERGATRVLSSVHEDNHPMRSLNDKLTLPSAVDPDSGAGPHLLYAALLEVAPPREPT